MRLMSTRMHGVIDYVMAVGLFALPRLLNWSGDVTLFMTVMAVGLLLYSLLTRYELGAIHAIPMQAHLWLDYAAGAAFLVAAFLFQNQPDTVRLLLGVIGVLEIGAAAITDPVPSGAVSGARARTRQPGM